MESRPSAVVLRVDIGLVLQQQLNHILIVSGCSDNEWCASISRSRIDISVVVKQQGYSTRPRNGIRHRVEDGNKTPTALQIWVSLVRKQQLDDVEIVVINCEKQGSVPCSVVTSYLYIKLGIWIGIVS